MNNERGVSRTTRNNKDAASAQDSMERLRRVPVERLGNDAALTVDHELLRMVVRKQLSDSDANLVYELIHAFQHWDDAHSAVIIEEQKQRAGKR